MIKTLIRIIKADGFQKHFPDFFLNCLRVTVHNSLQQSGAVFLFDFLVKPRKDFSAENILHFLIW